MKATEHEPVYRPGDTFVALDAHGSARRWRIREDGGVEASDWVSPQTRDAPAHPGRAATSRRPAHVGVRWVLIAWAAVSLVVITYTFWFAPTQSDFWGTLAGTGTVILLLIYGGVRRCDRHLDARR